MKGWMAFLSALVDPLWQLYEMLFIHRASSDEAEMQIALNIVRAAKNAQARQDIFGALDAPQGFQPALPDLTKLHEDE